MNPHTETPHLVATKRLHEDLTGYGLILLAIVAAQVSLFYRPELGAYLTAMTLALLMALAARYPRVRSLILGIAIIPLLGMINLSLIQQSAFEQTAVLYGSMLILSIIYRFMLRHRTVELNNHLAKSGYFKYGVICLVIGGLLGLMSYKLLIGNYVFGGVSLGLVMVVAVLGALGEESLFRGLIERQAMGVMKPLQAALLTSLIYVSLSFSHFTLWSLVVGAISTLVLSYIYTKKSNLILTALINLTSKLVYVWLVATFLIR